MKYMLLDEMSSGYCSIFELMMLILFHFTRWIYRFHSINSWMIRFEYDLF